MRQGSCTRFAGSASRGPLLLPNAAPSELLDIRMSVEALIVQGTTMRRPLIPVLDPRLEAIGVILNERSLPQRLLAYVPGAVSPTTMGPNTLARETTDPDRYADIPKVDIFLGPAYSRATGPPTRSTSRSSCARRTLPRPAVDGANLYDVYSNARERLYEEGKMDPSHNSIRIFDDDRTVVARGTVIKIGDRELLLKMNKDGKYRRPRRRQHQGCARSR